MWYRLKDRDRCRLPWLRQISKITTEVQMNSSLTVVQHTPFNSWFVLQQFPFESLTWGGYQQLMVRFKRLTGNRTNFAYRTRYSR